MKYIVLNSKVDGLIKLLIFIDIVIIMVFVFGLKSILKYMSALVGFSVVSGLLILLIYDSMKRFKKLRQIIDNFSNLIYDSNEVFGFASVIYKIMSSVCLFLFAELVYGNVVTCFVIVIYYLLYFVIYSLLHGYNEIILKKLGFELESNFVFGVKVNSFFSSLVVISIISLIELSIYKVCLGLLENKIFIYKVANYSILSLGEYYAVEFILIVSFIVWLGFINKISINIRKLAMESIRYNSAVATIVDYNNLFDKILNTSLVMRMLASSKSFDEFVVSIIKELSNCMSLEQIILIQQYRDNNKLKMILSNGSIIESDNKNLSSDFNDYMKLLKWFIKFKNQLIDLIFQKYSDTKYIVINDAVNNELRSIYTLVKQNLGNNVNYIVLFPIVNNYNKDLITICIVGYTNTYQFKEADMKFIKRVLQYLLENFVILNDAKESISKDELTNVYNRTYLNYYLLRKFVKNGFDRFTLAIFDIDNFKKFNDNYGHMMGDKILQMVAMTVKNVIREDDILARYGGEEFVVILNNITKEKSIEVIERIRKAVEQLKIYDDITGNVVSVTISIGVAFYPEDFIDDSNYINKFVNDKFNHNFDYNEISSIEFYIKKFIDKADRALYIAKKSGKNRFVLYCDINKEG